METRLSLAPGQNGTKKLVTRYGDRLVCVRYRYDPERKLRHKTVELIVETAPWSPRARNARRDLNDMVAVRIAYSEADLRQRIKAAASGAHATDYGRSTGEPCVSSACRRMSSTTA